MTALLSDLIRPAGKRATADSDLPVYSVTKHAGFVPSLEYFRKQVFSRNLGGYKVVAPGNFAYATIHLDEGSIGIAPEWGLVSPMYTVFEIDDTRVDPGYLIRYLKSPRAFALYPQLGRGAVHRRMAISLSALGTLPIPLPQLAEQRRIAAILDQADSLRAKRRQVLAHLDALTQSLFHNMFGGCEETIALGEIGTWRSGGTPPRSAREFFDGDIPWFSSGELGRTYVTDSVEHVSEDSIAKTSVKAIPAGSILVGMYDTAALKSSIVTQFSTCNQAIAFSLIDERSADTLFVYWAIQSARKRVLTLRRGIRQKNLNLSMIREISIPHVPLSVQRNFVARAKAISQEARLCLTAADADDELFTSLQSRAFRGEL